MIGLCLAIADLRHEWADTLSRSLALAAGLVVAVQLLGLQGTERPLDAASRAQDGRKTADLVDPSTGEPAVPGPADQLVRLSDPQDRGQAILTRITAGPEGDLAADEIRVTGRLAGRLGLEPGDIVTATLSDDHRSAKTSLALRVVAVEAPGELGGNQAIASPALVGIMAAYRRGEGIAAWGIAGKPGPYSGNVALAPTPLFVPEPAAAPEPSDDIGDAPAATHGKVIISALAALAGFWALHSVFWTIGLLTRKRKALSSLLMMGCTRRQLLVYGSCRALLPVLPGAALAAGSLLLLEPAGAVIFAGLVASAVLIGLIGSFGAALALAPIDGLAALAADPDPPHEC